MSNATEVWTGLDAWFATRTGAPLNTRPPASASDVAELESTIGRALPDDLRGSLAVHDSCEDGVDWLVGKLSSARETAWSWQREMVSFDEEYAEEYWDEPGEDPRVRGLVFHPGRVPIAYWDLGGVGTYLDFVPTPDGEVGQVIVQVSECDFVRVADSFAAFLERFVHLLRTGQLDFAKAGPEYPGLRGSIGKREATDRAWHRLPTAEIVRLFP